MSSLAAPPALAEESAPDQTIRVVAGTGGSGLFLRQGPGRQHPPLAVLPDATPLRVLDGPVSDGQGEWYHVQLQGAAASTLSGYCSGAYLKDAGPPASSPGAEAAPGSYTFRAKVTGYAVGADGGAVGNRTASGTRPQWGTIAADTRLFPFGTRMRIEGFEDTVFVVEDTGGAVKGHVVDIFFPRLATAIDFGTQFRQVTVLPPGS